MFDPLILIEYAFYALAALFALSAHECAHGYAAYRLGDPTARNLGRLTLNPLKHLDPVGTLCMIFLHFGWAKPVPINARYFENPRQGMAITAAAGPLTNLFLSLLAVPLTRLLMLLGNTLISLTPETSAALLLGFFQYLLDFLYIFHILNLSLFVFNLIPLPPLDGSRILYAFLPPKWYFGVMKYERTIQIALMIALFFGFFTGWISLIVERLSNGLYFLFSFIPTTI